MLAVIEDDLTPANRAYRRALDERDRAEKAASAAALAARKGDAALREAMDARGRLAPVSEAVAKHRATSIKNGLGAHAPLPEKLIAGRKALYEADQLVSEVQSALNELAAEHAEAQARLETAREAIRPAARVLMAEEIGTVADRFEEVMKQGGPLLRELVLVHHSFVAGPLDGSRPDMLPTGIVERVSAIISGQQQAVLPMMTEASQSVLRERLIGLMRG